MSDEQAKPTVRVLLHMARSGGTVISKCLGSMAGVALLSEVHPMSFRGGPNYDPLIQAHRWHGLLTPEDRARISAAGTRPSFADAIALIDHRCRERGRTLLVRDWTHLDLIGIPFMPPTGRLLTVEALSDRFRVVQTATVRHPIDQWLSLRLLPMMAGRLTLEAYLAGCRLFAERAVEMGFLKYEDFVQNPDEQLRILCERLDLTFDPTYTERWAQYRNITGDVRGARAGTEIKPVPRRSVEPSLLERCRANADYVRTLELLGYDDAE